MSRQYVRFMGFEELDKYLSNKTLKNTTRWEKRAQKTQSVGFCFFDDSVQPEERIEYLTGIVDMSVVAVFEPVGNMKLRESTGRYRDPDKELGKSLFELLFEPVQMMTIKEYCTTEYSKKTMCLVKVGYPVLKTSGYGIDWISIEKYINRRKVIPLRKCSKDN